MTGLLMTLAAAMLLVALLGLMLTVLATGPLWAIVAWSAAVLVAAGALVASYGEMRRQ